ncbi:MAG: site-2 protease family protein [Dehalococcoidia bacterium]|nr:site-2 protease family protein [Dehalococcoidia bacterium]
MIFLSIIAFALVLGLLIFVHELGHFLAAKKAGIKVEEFGMGFPPKLFGIKRGETVYSINVIPLGGFTKLMGEEDPAEPRSFASKKPLTRLWVLAAGPLMNAILPVVLLSIAFMIPRDIAVGDVTINEVAPNSPAAQAGILPGDIIVGMGGVPIQNIGELVYNTHLNLGKSVTVEVLRADGVTEMLTLVPRWDPPEDEGPIGVALSLENAYTISKSYPIWEAIPKSGSTLAETFSLLRNEVRSWFIRGSPPQVTGPIGIFELTGEASQAGPSYLLQFAAFLSLNLAIINLFPLPALDGGRIVFILLEIARRGRRVSPRTEGMIHLIGFAALISLIVLITYFDVLRMIRGESLIP